MSSPRASPDRPLHAVDVALAQRDDVAVQLGEAPLRDGAGVEPGDVVEQRSSVVVRLREVTPGVDDRAPSRLSFPYRAISIPWTAKPVTIDWVGRP